MMKRLFTLLFVVMAAAPLLAQHAEEGAAAMNPFAGNVGNAISYGCPMRSAIATHRRASAGSQIIVFASPSGEETECTCRTYRGTS